MEGLFDAVQKAEISHKHERAVGLSDERTYKRGIQLFLPGERCIIRISRKRHNVDLNSWRMKAQEDFRRQVRAHNNRGL